MTKLKPIVCPSVSRPYRPDLIPRIPLVHRAEDFESAFVALFFCQQSGNAASAECYGNAPCNRHKWRRIRLSSTVSRSSGRTWVMARSARDNDQEVPALGLFPDELKE